MDFVSKNLTTEVAAVVVRTPTFSASWNRRSRSLPWPRRRSAFHSHGYPISLGLSLLPANTEPISRGGKANRSALPRDSRAAPGPVACKTKWLRKMPGRLVGQTVDVDGKRASFSLCRPVNSTSAREGDFQRLHDFGFDRLLRDLLYVAHRQTGTPRRRLSEPGQSPLCL